MQSFFWNSLGDGVASVDDNAQPYTTPHQLTSLSGIMQVAVGDDYGMALAQDGVVWQWGLFDQTNASSATEGSLVPVARTDVSGIIAISAGMRTFFAQDGFGNLSSWGNGELGKRGTGTEISGSAAMPVIGPQNDPIAAVAGGAYGTVAVSADGSLLTWGAAGFLGNGSNFGSGSWFPVQLPSNTTFASLGAGPQLNYAVGSGGTLQKWGTEFYQTDFEHSTQRITAVPEVTGVAQVAVGALNQSFVVKTDGSVLSWGSNVNGELGLGDTTDRVSPEVVAGLSGVAKIVATKSLLYDVDTSVNNYASYNLVHALALGTGGTVSAWGANDHGQLGDGSTITRTAPVSVPGLTGVTDLAAGMGHSLALKGDGTVWAWGHNHFGQLGDNSTTDRLSPVQVTGLTGVTKIGARGYYSYAVKADGSVYAWGFAEKPGFNVILAPAHTPQLVTNLPPVSDVASGEYVMLALLPDHTVLAWSTDYSSGSSLARDPASALANSTPAPVVGMRDVVKIDCPRYAFALKSDGSLWGWGFSDKGVFGDNAAWANQPTYVLGFGALSSTQSTLGTASIGDSWLFQNFSIAELLNPAVSGDAGDASGDGIPNLIKYALGLNPRQHNDPAYLPTTRIDTIVSNVESTGASVGGIQLFDAPTVDLSNGKRYLAFTANRLEGIRSDVDYIVEVSTDLVTWHGGDPYTVTILDTAETLEVYSATSLDDVPIQFMRLRVQRK